MDDFTGKKILILGYGREGQSTHRFLSAHIQSTKISLADKKRVEPVIDNVGKIYTGEGYLDNLSEFDIVIKSPGIPTHLPAIQNFVKKGGKITSHINIFFQNLKGKTIGITGSKGKSTTASLLANILKEEFSDVRLAGNIGEPALDKLEGSSTSTIFVLELSSFQLEQVRYSPHIAVLLNIFPGHQDFHITHQNYVAAKRNITKFQNFEDVVVFNPENEEISRLVEKSPAKKATFSFDSLADVFFKNNEIFLGTSSVISTQSIPLLGKGNIENTMAAIVVSNILGVPKEKIRKGISSFKPLKHRLEFVGEKNKVKFYNDSIASIPEATIHAIDTLGEIIDTLILGGYERGSSYENLGLKISQTKIKNLILFPETGKKIAEEAKKAGAKVNVYETSSMEDAVKHAYKITSPDKICLLSPGSSSFGIFKDFEERGDLFRKEVEKL